MASSSPPLIYDLGMNNGDDSAYYLAKGFRVVGVDANPDMCAAAAVRFESEIAVGQMEIMNVGVGQKRDRGQFSVNTEKHAISTFSPEKFSEEWVPQTWRTVEVDIIPLSEIVQAHDIPYFVKIDVEFFDRLVLRDLQKAGIRPRFISTEAHDIECFDLLVAMGYGSLRLMPGAQVHETYADAQIRRLDGAIIPFGFAHDSSGPFDDDFPEPWMSPATARTALLEHGLGWIDIHARLGATH